jgi:transcriptional regulator with XRE-family HTH domain
MESDQPFSKTLSGLMDMMGVGNNELSRRLKHSYRGWGSPGTISRYTTGELVPTLEAMERIAGVLGHISPRTFAEYRLELARRDFDPSPEDEGGVGLPTALRNLDRWNRVR